jgi:glycosyltransferase involved in cell wall biosynthesis
MEKNSRISRICLIPNVSGVGGMVSFREKLVKGLAERRIGVSYDLVDTPYEAILVIGGTRDLAGLWRAKRGGVRIVQRLDGMNWIHRRRRTGWRHYLRAEYGNLILSWIRSRLADQIIYQSEFSHQWWERVYGLNQTPWHVVYNGVDLERYTPDGFGDMPGDHVRILLVEGTIGGGYELGLQTAVQMGERLHSDYSHDVEIMVVGRVSANLQSEWKRRTEINVIFTGQVPGERIPEIDRSAHVLYASDVNPACPNSVIEALACGLPVVGFDTGALAEIITEGSGQLVPYGGNPWKLEPPDILGIAKAVNDILGDQPGYRKAARKRAEEAFGLDHMVEGYLNVLST